MTGIIVSENQVNYPEKLASGIELFGMAAHAVAFIVLYKNQPSYSYPVADLVRLISDYVLAVVIKTFFRKRI